MNAGVVRVFNCDNPTDRQQLNNKDIEFLRQIIGAARIVFIDEGQKVLSIGQTLKLLVDHYGATKQILVTGSSSIHLLIETFFKKRFTRIRFLVGNKTTYMPLP